MTIWDVIPVITAEWVGDLNLYGGGLYGEGSYGDPTTDWQVLILVESTTWES